MKRLIPLGSITGDPIGVKRYMVIDANSWCTSVSETICLLPDGREWKNPSCRETRKWDDM